MAHELRQQKQQHQKSGQAQDQHTEAVDAVLEGCGRLARLHGTRDRAQPCIAPRRDHEHPDLAGDEARSAEQGAIRPNGGIARARRLFFDGKGLAGQARFVGHRIMALEDQPVRRDEIAGVKRDHVTRDDLPDGYVGGSSAAKNRDLHRHRAAQRVDGILGLGLLEDIEGDRRQHDENDDDQALPVAGRPRDQRGDQQDRDQRLDEPLGDLEQHPSPKAGHGEIGPEAPQSFGSLGLTQPLWRRPQAFQQRVPAVTPEICLACRGCFPGLRRHAGLSSMRQLSSFKA